MKKNADEWTRRVETSKEEIPVSKRIMHGLLQALKGEPLSSVFSPDGALISASAAPHCGGRRGKKREEKDSFVGRSISSLH